MAPTQNQTSRMDSSLFYGLNAFDMIDDGIMDQLVADFRENQEIESQNTDLDSIMNPIIERNLEQEFRSSQYFEPWMVEEMNKIEYILRYDIEREEEYESYIPRYEMTISEILNLEYIDLNYHISQIDEEELADVVEHITDHMPCKWEPLNCGDNDTDDERYLILRVIKFGGIDIEESLLNEFIGIYLRRRANMTEDAVTVTVDDRIYPEYILHE